MEKASSAKQPKRSSVTAGITVVGMGNWGTSLIAALTRARVSLVEVVVRQRLGRQGDTLPEVKAEDAVYNANVLWLCVPDREIAAVAAQIAEHRPDLRGQAVIHSSGAATLAALRAVKRAGAEVAGIAPVFSFPTREPVSLEGVAFMVECRPPLWPQASSLVERLGGRPFRINSADKVLYHAAATMASPLLVSALESAVATARLAGLGEDDAKIILGALALTTARNYFEGSSAKSFSGPFARGDAQTVELHLDALLKHPKLYDIYVALAKNAIANLPVRNLRGLQRALNIAPAGKKSLASRHGAAKSKEDATMHSTGFKSGGLRRQAERDKESVKEMTEHTECYPISILPHSSRLFLDYAEQHGPLSPFFPSSPYSNGWMLHRSSLDERSRERLATVLETQNREVGAGDRVLANIAALRRGANAVVTGQQVTLLGGPLYTLFKAATAIRKAQDAMAAGYPHVPIFWLATEDHDLEEADHVTFPSRREMHRLTLERTTKPGLPVGGLDLGGGIGQILDEAAGLLEPGPMLDALQACYRPEVTFGKAFASFLSRVFAAHGLIVIDASSRECHALGAEVLRQAITSADTLVAALTERDKLLVERGYHSQVLVNSQSGLLFLLDAESGVRLPLKQTSDGWAAGKKSYTQASLLEILETEPERLSPNALLRPVFQDAILPTSAYIGGPAEIAYFAQSQVLYERILGRTTPVLPRLSATLIEPPMAQAMQEHELSLTDVISHRPEELALRIAARAMPVENKRKLAAAGNALDAELSELTAYLASLDAGLGRSADVAASKMRYQMNRLRRLGANYQLQREASLRRHADALALALFPNQHLQERLIGAAWFLSRYGEALPSLLVEHAAQECPGHKAIFL